MKNVKLRGKDEFGGKYRCKARIPQPCSKFRGPRNCAL